ncbi:MAG: right-handed parallel beta-helix repeat-containing protein, partial [Chloroflexi bacterium]|nr:right-handed parallel beta-helix repeat-containing protein [Chloroflexota bacterium]
MNSRTRQFCAVLAVGIGLTLILLAGLQRAQAAPAGTLLFVKTSGSGTACTQLSPCTLQIALAQAADGDTGYVAGGAYTGAGGAVITVTKSITLYGGWDGASGGPVERDPAAYPTTLDGEDQRRVVYIENNTAPTLEGFVITGGHGDFSGGGIYAESASPIIRNNQIVSNSAAGDGGAIFVNRGSAQIVGNTIMENTATWSGGLRIINDADVTIVGNEIVGNVASIAGGGIDIECCGGATPFIARNFIASNQGGSRGGGVIVQDTNARLENNILASNQASEGAGIWLQGMASHPVSITLVHNTLVGQTNGDEAVWAEPYVTATLVNNILASHSTGITTTAPASSTVLAAFNLFWNDADPVTGSDAVLGDPLQIGRAH